MSLPQPPLLVITDRHQATAPLPDIAAAAFAGGCRWLSLREKDLPPPERLALLRALLAVGRRWGATVTVHDDIDAALAAGADGVHLPGGAAPAEARRRLGATSLIGCSAHGGGDIARVAREGADYVTLSPVFLTQSKPGYGPAIGIDGLRRSTAAAALPVLALGGIGAAEVAPCIAAGAHGIAVMGEIMRADDPQRATAALLDAFGRRSCSPCGAPP